MTIRFEVGKSYACRSVCDYDCIFTFEVVARTASTITIRGSAVTGTKRRKLRERDGVEIIDPLGRYSMSPVLCADKPADAKVDVAKPQIPTRQQHDGERLVVTELHYHRNGVHGAGYYAGRAEWRVDEQAFHVIFTAFDRDEHIAILADGDVATSFRYEDFAKPLRAFIASRGGQAIAFPHTIGNLIDFSAERARRAE